MCPADRPARESEMIEVTPEMIAAGEEAFGREMHDAWSYTDEAITRETVRAIYLAMTSARLKDGAA